VDFGSIRSGHEQDRPLAFHVVVAGQLSPTSRLVSQVDQFGKPRLSLIVSVENPRAEPHKWTPAGRLKTSGPISLSRNVPDGDFLPDNALPQRRHDRARAAVTNAAIIGELAMTNLSIKVTAAPPAGWTYFRFGDPARAIPPHRVCAPTTPKSPSAPTSDD